ncbi:holin [Oceanobacillus alkalisoli]|uniref:holin n=1 Tax=Oceanobacillus alkalisoli TaxID=2925113 RepID=UPI001EF03042|nr:holin [Oceanobacillus alkalisoli]MCF3942114.1 holin [Oceanobacillus alkalisoli]MCG5105021.1 holin [Oceanobacillus alkalisoli]
MIEILMMGTVIAPVTSGIVQALKVSKIVPKRFLPLAAIFIGVGLGASATFLGADLLVRSWAGGISGLAATGLFELSKNGKDNSYPEEE